jgi:hypothetical protein
VVKKLGRAALSHKLGWWGRATDIRLERCAHCHSSVSVANSYSRGDREFEKAAAMLFPSEIAQRGRMGDLSFPKTHRGWIFSNRAFEAVWFMPEMIALPAV